MINVLNLTKKYKSGEEFTAINDVSFNIQDGEFVAIVGRSGSGKSTLLNMLGTLDSITSGHILIDDKDIALLSQKQQAITRNKLIGFVFQSYHLEPLYSVYKNVEMPLLIANISKNERKKRVGDALERFDLTSKIHCKTQNLSGGEKQRVAIARAIVNNPKIILADEPCGNLDLHNSTLVMDYLRDLSNCGITVVLVTHNLLDAKRADRIITLQDGRIISDEKS